MHDVILALSLLGLAALLVAAVWSDLVSLTISNRLNAAIALLAPLYWWGAGLPLGEVALQVALALAVLALFAVVFAARLMGGGDVKMLAALALWLRPDQLVMMLFVMSLAGGALTVVMMIRHRVLRRSGGPEIPYGVAISVAACVLFYEPVLNQFA